MAGKIKIFIFLIIIILVSLFIYNEKINDIINDNELVIKFFAKKIKIVEGTVTFKDEIGNVVYETNSTLFNNNLIAVSTRDFVNGPTLQYRLDDKLYEINNGYWEPDDVVSFWHVEGLNNSNSNLKLVNWNKRKPITWYSLTERGKKFVINKIRKTRRIDNAELFVVSDKNINTDGIFIQSGHLVGWTFSSLSKYGILWNESNAFRHSISYKKLFDNYCLNGREYYYDKALRENKYSEKLKLLAEALYFPYRFRIYNRDDDLDINEIIQEIHGSLKYLYHNNRWDVINSIMTPEIIAATNNEGILNYSIEALAKGRNTSAVLNMLEYLVDDERLQRNLKKVVVSKYIEYGTVKIDKLIHSGEYYEALTLFNILYSINKENPELNLLGVDILLWLNDCSGAEHLLKSIDYPAQYNNRINELWISLDNLREIDKEEQKIDNTVVINFPKNQRSINVEAVINNYYTQSFIIDTGASMTTLPVSVLDDMGIHVMIDSPEHTISTAGGIIIAREVDIDSINLKNCQVNDLKVLALDIPGQPGKGLLGINFLKHFHVEINHENGTLTLTPKEE